MNNDNYKDLRVGKYIGKARIFEAKRSSKIGILIAIILVIVISMIFIFGKNILPKIYTNNTETKKLTATLMIILIIYCAGCIILQTISGIYRGLGFQKISAIFVFISYWIISLPATIILLFMYSYKYNLYFGVGIIWSGLAFGNVFAAICCAMYLIFRINWNEAVKQSTSRINNTIKEYKSTNNFS